MPRWVQNTFKSHLKMVTEAPFGTEIVVFVVKKPTLFKQNVVLNVKHDKVPFFWKRE